MAASTGKVLCKYFMSGCCKNGYQCTFSHNWKDKPDMSCKYYLRGGCEYGDRCRYDHVKLKEEYQSEKKSVAAVPVNLPSLVSSNKGLTSSAVHTDSTTATNLVTLKKDPSRNPKKWIQAAEFVPGKAVHGQSDELTLKEQAHASSNLGVEDQQVSYSDIAWSGVTSFLDVISAEEAASLLCPFAEMGECPFGESCEYLHGELCDMCNKECLNPFDPEQQKAHHSECLQMHEREMERAFQVQESEAKQCAICLEYITGKLNKTQRRFGILPNCEHCFCLTCMRKWRQTTHTMKKTIRACPLCRKVSFFVIPSEVWIDDKEQKSKLIDTYKGNLSKSHCKYFNMGLGTCPFGSSCFYKHVFPDGTEANDEQRYFTSDDGLRQPLRKNTLWDFVREREEILTNSPNPSEGQSNITGGEELLSEVAAEGEELLSEVAAGGEELLSEVAAGGEELLSEVAAGGEELHHSVPEEMFQDRDMFWPTFEPKADNL